MPEAHPDFFTMDDFDLEGKTVFVRIDVNSPIHPETKEVLGNSRFKSHLETINALRNSKVVLITHQSRPGTYDFTTTRQHAAVLRRLTGRDVKYVDALFGKNVEEEVRGMSKGDIIMLENSRFYSEETAIDPSDLDAMMTSNIVEKLSPLMDYYIIDAFPAIHRSQTTLVGFCKAVPNIAGKLIEKEISMLEKFRSGTDHPKIAILGGSKIEDSITVSKSFLEKGIVDTIITGGVVGNAFLWASGIDIGKKNRDFILKNNKNHEKLLDTAKFLVSKYRDRILVPQDVVLNPSGKRVKIGENGVDGEIMADIGLDTVVVYSEAIMNSKAIFMNGPMGMYELDRYSVGTREIMSFVARTNALKIVGGGHTLGALEKLDMLHKIDHASSGGGSLISYLSGEPMPVIEALKRSKSHFKGNLDGRR
ncbi:phosphoglycerate kinase [uncultured archaeon]|nr:phosphoglycerate kinase [uncultured archaeon]